MKIGIVTPGGFDRSGQQRVIPVFLGLTERLARRHEVHVYTLEQYPQPCDYPLCGAMVHNIGGEASRGLLRAARRVRRTLRALVTEHRRGRFDALHGLWANESGLSAVLAGRLLGVPTVVSVVGGELVALPEIGYGGQLARKNRVIVAWSLRLAGAVTAASDHMLRPLRQRRADARLVPLGVDTYRFTPPDSSPPGPPWRLLHVASLNRVKDQPTLLRAFQKIHAAEPETRLDILGEDTLNGEIQRMARDLSLEKAVTFYGFQPSDAVAGALRRSHLLLHSSLSEAGPWVMLEAAACGVPTVGTAVGHIRDLAPEAAVAVPIGDHESLAGAALALLREDPVRQALGQRALAWSHAHNLDRTAAEFEALYAVSLRPAQG